MNDFLALTILELIQKGEFTGFLNVRDEVKKMDSFFDLTDIQFRYAMFALQEQNCIIPLGGGVQRDFYRLNPDKDCLNKYKEKVQQSNNQKSSDDEIKRLTKENLKLANELIPLQKKDLQDKIKWGILGLLGGAVLTNLKEIIKGILWLWKCIFH